ncbi:zinc finger protein 718-like isoform X1 [Spodoptera litura]|uniref:Zinc finger protein 718-like isoform X1 n=1 Tax=Spodoptera litura TaxID=69820 RepID=A0A9J7ISZ6_SPOLT|nr:zinc finger protein 718-like isoform X1 [Spodoptera litura]XP_022824745.1 zinc finger protein 718-like isoform X1 [Spodoptera litura]
MEDVRVCRICLNMEVEMQDLMSYPLETYFASMMIDNKPLYPTLPPYACYQCAALVKKYHFFKQKCLQSQVLLCGIIDDCGKLIATQIKSIDKQNLLAISKVTQISIEQDTTDCLDIEQPVFATEVIKKEYHDDVDLDVPDPCSPYNYSSDDESKKSEEQQDLEKDEIQVKIDDELDEPELPETIVEVPKLPVRKTRLGPSKKEGRSKRMATKSKKIINKMKDVESEDNADMDDITIVILTLEEQLEEMNKRKQSSNYLNCTYQCHLCYKGFNNTHAWKHHLTKHSPNAGDLECRICKYRFKTKRNLQRHALNHGKKFVCKLCPYNSSNITTVKQHQGSHKGITYKCKYCDEVFTVRTTYVSHMRIKHPSENICCYCGYSFYSKRGLVVHKNMVHKDYEIKSEENAEDGPYCAECDVKFVSSVAYKRHMVMSVKHTQSTDSINGCRVCGAMFSDPEELRVHHRKEHPKRQPVHYRLKGAKTKWPAQCEHCPEEIPNARAYWKHFRLMHPNENYPLQKNCVCDICGKMFTCNALLVMHKRTHFGERPYKCSQCDKACFTAFDLRVHQQKHSDTRPFPCNICSKAFKRKEALERHLKIHSGDNPFKCEICGVAFSKSCTRTLHVRTVHTKEPAPTRRRRLKDNK